MGAINVDVTPKIGDKGGNGQPDLSKCKTFIYPRTASTAEAKTAHRRRRGFVIFINHLSNKRLLFRYLKILLWALSLDQW